MANRELPDQRPLLAIYTPHLQGVYFGELVGHLLQLGKLKNYRVTVIQTGGLGKYSSTFQLDNIDAVVFLRNAVHNNLAKAVLKKGIPAVSIAYDYFPLEIPVVSCNNQNGIKLALDHLQAAKHQHFGFAGNLANFDTRKRYESFCKDTKSRTGILPERNLFPIKDDLLTGGYQAAEEYVESGCNASGIICGTTLNALGFYERLSELDADRSTLVDIVGFDSISLAPLNASQITTIDQNLNLLAEKALSVLELDNETREQSRHFQVDPKLISVNNDYAEGEDAFLANSFELAELYSANYMKSVLYNMREWTREIHHNNLDNIMTLRPLFKRHLDTVIFGRIATGKSGKQYFKTEKLITKNNVVNIGNKDKSSLCEVDAYPVGSPAFDPLAFDESIHIPLIRNNEFWGAISVFGIDDGNQCLSSYSALCTYLNWIADLQISNPLASISSDQQPTQHNPEEPLIEETTGTITWDKLKNEFLWDEKSLEILGLNHSLDKTIYQHMDIFDRIESRDQLKLQEHLTHNPGDPFVVNLKIKHKNKSYLFCEISGTGEHPQNIATIKIKQYGKTA